MGRPAKERKVRVCLIKHQASRQASKQTPWAFNSIISVAQGVLGLYRRGKQQLAKCRLPLLHSPNAPCETNTLLHAPCQRSDTHPESQPPQPLTPSTAGQTRFGAAVVGAIRPPKCPDVSICAASTTDVGFWTRGISCNSNLGSMSADVVKGWGGFGSCAVLSFCLNIMLNDAPDLAATQHTTVLLQSTCE